MPKKGELMPLASFFPKKGSPPVAKPLSASFASVVGNHPSASVVGNQNQAGAEAFPPLTAAASPLNTAPLITAAATSTIPTFASLFPARLYGPSTSTMQVSRAQAEKEEKDEEVWTVYSKKKKYPPLKTSSPLPVFEVAVPRFVQNLDGTSFVLIGGDEEVVALDLEAAPEPPNPPPPRPPRKFLRKEPPTNVSIRRVCYRGLCNCNIFPSEKALRDHHRDAH